MEKVKQSFKSIDLNPVRWILGGLSAITLYFQTNLNDPFNSPKLWILLLIATWLLGYIYNYRRIIIENKQTIKLLCIVLAFVTSAFASTLVTDLKYVSFFGETQRRNGFLTYLSLSIILISSALFIRTFNIKQLFYITYLIATIFGTYAFMQSIGKDFVEWNNPYNSIVGTVGNPNFSAAVMAVMGVLILSSTFISSFSLHFRIFGGILALALLGLIYKSDALQGLLSYAIGISLFLLLLAYKKNKKLGIVLASSGAMVFLCGVLGMLQIGPLERFLYKPSVSVRGYYWRAGLEMFRDNPIFGVGMDRYGAYFKQYREVGYPLNYGFEITSTNAHNTFIQFFATGGVFLGTTYLVLNSYIALRAIIGLKNQSGNNRLLLAGVFSAWIAFHAQSLVSIDNIGISIWGWILGGSIIGISISSAHSEIDDKKPFFIKHSDINLGRLSISSLASTITIVLVVLLYRAESNTYNSKVNFDVNDQILLTQYKELQMKAINSKLNDPNYKINCAISLVQAGFTTEGFEQVKKLYAQDPRNLDAMNSLALISEQLNNIPEAISYRLKMVDLDPWNAVNYLQLGRNYKIQGDLENSKAMLDKIISFVSGPNGAPIVEAAKAELAN